MTMLYRYEGGLEAARGFLDKARAESRCALIDVADLCRQER
jgi:hypothetical protein